MVDLLLVVLFTVALYKFGIHEARLKGTDWHEQESVQTSMRTVAYGSVHRA